MNIGEFKSQIKNLEALWSKIHISKIATIQNLKKLHSNQKESFQFALNVKEIFSYCKKKFGITSFFYEGSAKLEKLPKLFIYFSSKKNMLSVENDVLEQTLREHVNREKDFIIAVGKEAIEYTKKCKNVIYSFKNKKHISQDLSSIILSLFRNQSIGTVEVLLHSQRVHGHPITILPLSKLENTSKHVLLDENIKYSFYPDLANSLRQLFHTYTNFVIQALIWESDFYVIKQKIFKHTLSENAITEKITLLKRQKNKIKQEALTNDILVLSTSQKKIKRKNMIREGGYD